MGKKWRHKEFVTCSRSQSKLIAVFASCSFPCAGLFWGSSFLSPEVRGVCSLPTFSPDPCLWDATVGKGECFFYNFSYLRDTVHDKYEIKWKRLLLPFHIHKLRVCLWCESQAWRGGWLWLSPSWSSPWPHRPPKLGSRPGNTRCKAPVSQAAAFLLHGLCLAPLQISFTSSPYSANILGPILWQAMYKECWGCCRESPHNSYSQWVPSLVQVHPCHFSLHITTWT